MDVTTKKLSWLDRLKKAPAKLLQHLRSQVVHRLLALGAARKKQAFCAALPTRAEEISKLPPLLLGALEAASALPKKERLDFAKLLFAIQGERGVSSSLAEWVSQESKTINPKALESITLSAWGGLLEGNHERLYKRSLLSLIENAPDNLSFLAVTDLIQKQARGYRTEMVSWAYSQMEWEDNLTDRIEFQGLVREAARLKSTDGPIVVGPWLSEVGFEVLYWVPFLNWFVAYFDIPRDRLWCVSRGGAKPWYETITSNYVDIFELMTPEEFRSSNEKRWAGTGKRTQKQGTVSEFDRAVVDKIQSRKSWSEASLLHPSLMYSTLVYFWKGSMGTHWMDAHARFRPFKTETFEQIRRDLGLPKQYYAVKIYFNASFPKTTENEEFCRSLVERLSRRFPVVMLDTGLKIDDHDELSNRLKSGNVIYLNDRLDPVRNLAQQTAVVHGAEGFYGTYGGFAYLGPFLNVPSLSFYSDPESFIHGHLHAADIAVQSLREQGMAKADFAAVNVTTYQGLWEESEAPSPVVVPSVRGRLGQEVPCQP